MRNLDLSDASLLTQSLVVSASAGSGKTFTLTVLVTANLGREDLRPFEILATTFSEAAAADLRERLLRPLDLLTALDEPAWRAFLPLLQGGDPKALETFLKGLPLGERPRKSAEEVAQAAGHWAAASWTASPERARAFWRRIRREAELLQVSTIHSLAMRVLGQGAGAPETILDVAHPALLRLLRQTVREALTLPDTDPDHVPSRLLLTWAERNWESLSQGHDNHRDAMGHLHPEDPAPVRAALLAALATAEAALAPFAADPMLGLDASSSQHRHFKTSSIRPLPAAGADLATRLRWAEVQDRRVDPSKGYYSAALRVAMTTFEPVVDALEAWLRCLVVDALNRFEAEKTRQGLATFGDLVRTALHSLQDGPLEGVPPRLLLVDEYQDTSPSQDAFLAKLGAAQMVRVGDVKQAIYGFRGGDPELLGNHLQAAGERAFRLPYNFRSTPQVVALANRYVEEVWPQLAPGTGSLDGAQEAKAPDALPVGLVRTAAPSSRADLPALSDWISGLAREDGWRECLGEPPKPGPRRRTLLLKQRTKLPILLQRLKRQGIQPYVVAKEGFWDSPGVRLVMAALEAVAHPERSQPCVALLRQIVGLSDGDITRLALSREGRPGLPGLGQLDPEAFPEAQRDAVRWLQSLREVSAQALAGHLLNQGALLHSLAALNAHGTMEPLRARRNLSALLAMLLGLPASPSVAYAALEDERAGMERGDLPASADDADLLIQTVHASKGLEYDDVILPLLNGNPQSFRKGELRTSSTTGGLLLAWKLGQFEGRAYRELKPAVTARQRRDDLNLLYVALTRAKGRLCLLLQEPKEAKKPKEPKAPADTKTWARWGQLLADAHAAELCTLVDMPAPAPLPPVVGPDWAPPAVRPALAPEDSSADAHAALPAEARAKARQDGELIHAFLRDLLVRWEDPAGFAACLAAPPPVAGAKEHAERFLAAFEARGWRHLRRRTELPLAGAAASGAQGRADLVVWEDDRIHLLDFKNSKAFGPEELASYQAQLARYAQAIQAREGKPVEAWLVAIKSGEWVRVGCNE